MERRCQLFFSDFLPPFGRSAFQPCPAGTEKTAAPSFFTKKSPKTLTDEAFQTTLNTSIRRARAAPVPGHTNREMKRGFCNEETCWHPDRRRRLPRPERDHPRRSEGAVRPHGGQR